MEEAATSPWRVNILSLFPEMFPGPLAFSLAGKALEDGIWQLHARNIRDFATDKHATVDDKPFGGGTGMVMRPDILSAAIDSVYTPSPDHALIYFSPRGETIRQPLIQQLVHKKQLTLLCGRFEGIDQRAIDAYSISEISLGDFVLSGGEIAAFALIDACVRLLPGVIGSADALREESFGDGEGYSNLLEYPHFTRPALWNNRPVPEILLSGNHALIKAWRLAQAEALTKERRLDLWEKYCTAAGGST